MIDYVLVVITEKINGKVSFVFFLFFFSKRKLMFCLILVSVQASWLQPFYQRTLARHGGFFKGFIRDETVYFLYEQQSSH